ncbi:sugar-binding protein [Thalassotalea maritima]|uniref:carbohydrate binding family 9 domain-containing protein n=1 Tax=Thalassotalea maritima TaxID=3242416 RepID=UPI00352943F3
MLKTIISLTTAALVSFHSYAGAHYSDDAIVIPQQTGTINVDGNLSDPIWQHARRVKMNNITRPYNNIKNDFDTEAWLISDDSTLYIAFVAEDPEPNAIRAFYRDRDRSWGDDLVGIKIDTFNDQRQAYRFLSNPLGVQIDGIENEVTKHESDSWDGIWESAGNITDKGYVVEMALPLRMLNFNEDLTMQNWGIELVRYYPRDVQLRLSNIYMDRKNDCEICQHVSATGFKQAKQGANLTVAPSLVASSNQTRDENNQWQQSDDYQASLDVRWGITPDVLLNATINPDFSTVESDNAQLSINNTFALFNQEKRPFFLDNADYFDSNYNLIYTRNINAPNYGIKLTGRSDEHTFAFFVADDETTNILIPGNRSSSFAVLDANSQSGVLRYRQNVNADVTLGLTNTFRTSDDYYNVVTGLDADVRFSTADRLKVQLLQSATHYPDELFAQFCNSDDQQDCQQMSDTHCDLSGCVYNEQVLRTNNSDRFTGNAAKVSFTHRNQHWMYRGNVERQNAGFRGDLGFISHVDFNKVAFAVERRWYGSPNQWWTEAKIYSDWDMTHNDNQEMIEREWDVFASVHGQYDSWLQIAYTHRDVVGSRLDKSNLAIDGNTTLFTQDVLRFNAFARPISGISVDTEIVYGDKIDYRDNRAGKGIDFFSGLKWNINRHIELKLQHTFSQLDVAGSNKFIARLTDLRATYQFNVQSFLRLTTVFNNTSRNPYNYLYADPETIDRNSKNLSLKLLYGYKFNPQTAFYFGYSQQSVGYEQFSTLEQQDKSLFMKLSYAYLQ